MRSKPEGALLVGGVALPTAEDVFRTAASILGDRLRAIPDGETGPRLQWLVWQLPILAQMPGLDVVPCPPEMYGPWDRLRVAEGQDPAELELGELGYAHFARRSYGTFEQLKREGAIPAHCRFQVSLPTPLAPVTVFAVPDSHQLIEPAYERALLREVEQICAEIPHDQLAIQWDVCWEIAFLEGLIPPAWDGGVMDGVIERLARVAAAVPGGVDLGLHLCYGDYRHEHFKEPEDCTLLADILRRGNAAIERSIDWVHLPVPIERDDPEYFTALGDLELDERTELYLGLVHFADGVEGTRRRIDAASHTLERFGIACECGMARRPPGQIPDVMRIHRELCAPRAWTPTGAHLVGTLPLAGPEEAIRAAATVLPDQLTRISDGETGQLRSNWIGCQYPVLAGSRQLEQVTPAPGAYAPIVAFALREGVDPAAVRLPPLGYAQWAARGYEEFQWLGEHGVVPDHWRFQVSLPTPPAPMLVLVDEGSRAALEPVWKAALLSELAQILDAIPHERLAIQLDVCQEVGLWEGFYPSYWGDGVDVRERAIAGIAELADAVPDGVELGIHLCYGDYAHQHFMEPRDAGVLRDMANALAAAVARRIDYLHLPVPRERDDEDYVRPLADLALDPETQLYLGLLHQTDGEDGARRRIDVAHRFVDEFGVATECGFGRRSPVLIGELLELHRLAGSAR